MALQAVAGYQKANCPYSTVSIFTMLTNAMIKNVLHTACFCTGRLPGKPTSSQLVQHSPAPQQLSRNLWAQLLPLKAGSFTEGWLLSG